MPSRIAIYALVVGLGAASATSLAAQANVAQQRHQSEVAAWRADRETRLRRSDGWLTLAGLYWLVPGVNEIGSGPDNDVVLPASAPAKVGTLLLQQGQVTFTPKVPVVIDGKEANTPQVLHSDAKEAPTALSLGSVQFHLIDRAGRLGIRIKDANSPILRDFRGIENFPIQWAWRLEAAYHPYAGGKPLKVPSAQGTVDDELAPGYVELELAGRTYRLDALRGAEDNELFLIFGDTTNGHSTYGAGRFLYATVAGGNLQHPSTAIVDFNRAYNPPCAFTPYATCPLPPPQNKLPVPIEAGEKKYADHH